MAYKLKPKIYRLIFDSGEYAGVEVRVRSVPVGQYLKIARLSAETTADGGTEADMADELFRAFASALLEWNLTEDSPDGQEYEIPADVDGLYRLDLQFVLLLVQEWIKTMAGIDPDLGKGSTSGGTSEVASIPMEALSPSPPS